MKKKDYYMTASLLFLIVGGAHLIRALYKAPVDFGGVDIPVWFSWIAVILTWYLAWRGFTFAKTLK